MTRLWNVHLIVMLPREPLDVEIGHSFSTAGHNPTERRGTYPLVVSD